MLLSEMPGYIYPTLATFPFRWYETNRWLIYALKLLPSGDLKWLPDYVEAEGHAKAHNYATQEEARQVASSFNEGIAERIEMLGLSEPQKTSVTLKAEKEITVQERLADEELLMLTEALRRHASSPRPAAQDLILPSELQGLHEDLFRQLEEAPYLQIINFPRYRVALARTKEFDWTHRISPSKKCAVYCVREKIARGFGFSGTDHWGKTKAAIRALLLPRANQLLQHASIQKILLEAKSRGQRVVVMSGFVFWYEENGKPGWVVKTIGGDSASGSGQTIWHEGTIISKNHGRIVVLPYIKENGEKVLGHTKNSSHDGKAIPRHPNEYIELPFEILSGDLMIGLLGELPYE
ncbi:hypothetical protein [Pseudomonas sp. Irchel s3h14]|uniref:hypothetical protein n=1 Tax=Pseudomonas sp. Irchel s3h14 TaxID=2009179 RepID=UPI000BA4C13B|nr:hypothetical protein [Pseudomonas sp. Irchel s3h14]